MLIYERGSAVLRFFFTSSSKSDRTGLTGGGCIWNDIIDKDLDAQVGK